MTPLRVLIVDDEPPARRRLRRLLSTDRRVRVVGEAADAAAAIGEAKAQQPDLVLLDIQLPGLSGLGLLDRLPPPRPHVIFVTAFDAHAVRAFELEALDYLLKPVAAPRLAEAIDRAVRAGTPAGPARDLPPISRLPVQDRGRLELVAVGAIDWIEAADNYVVLHCGARSHVLRDTLGRLSRRLDGRQFLRIHRSTTVQADRIVALEPAGGDWVAVLRDGRRLPVSRTYRRSVRTRLAAEGR